MASIFNRFKSNVWRMAKWYILTFVLLFLFRIIYGYVVVNVGASNEYFNDFFSNATDLRKNYASEKMMGKTDVSVQASAASSQKYEKTATLKSKTNEFDRHGSVIKEKVKDYEAIIQYEQSLGNKGQRQLHLMIGVNPDRFDDFYKEAQIIGSMVSTEVVKVDKTNEYKQLNAQRESLEKTLISLIDLKNKGGQIADFVALHDKILEIEERLQGLGVELGNFDQENEFCTIKMSLYEGELRTAKISFIHRVKVALSWTVRIYFYLVFASFFFFLSVLVLLALADKLFNFSNILKN